MPAQYVTSIVEGQDFYVADIDPTGVVSAPRGSVCLRVDTGNALVYYNVTPGAAPGTGTVWVPLLSTDLTDNTQLTLAANANPALQVGPAVLLDLLKFVTTTGAAQVIINVGVIGALLPPYTGVPFLGNRTRVIKWQIGIHSEKCSPTAFVMWYVYQGTEFS